VTSRRRAALWGVLAGLLPLLAWAREGLRFGLEDVLGETGTGRQELREPVDVALLPGGEVAVLDAQREAVVVFSTAGPWKRTMGAEDSEGRDLGLRAPTALAADSSGRLWLVDGGNHRVLVLAANGAVLKEVGGVGALEGRFRSPSDVAIDEEGDRVYVADTGNERIQVLNSAGAFLAAWDDRPRERRGHVGRTVTLAWSDYGKGGLWVANEGSSRLEKFDDLGEWEESLDLAGIVPGPLRIERLEIDPAFYRMFVADSIGKRVLVVSRRGVLLSEVRSDERGSLDPRGLAVSRILDLFVADRGGGRVPWFRKR
jgi:hypothetical protein